jgi:hypothetical protein
VKFIRPSMLHTLRHALLPACVRALARTWHRAAARVGAVMCALALMTTAGTHAQSLSEAQLKAGLLLNFARYVEWPEGTFAGPTDPMQFCQMGRDSLGSAFTALEAKQINGRPIRIKNAMTADEARSCHVLFVSDSEERRIVPLLKSLADRPLLSISDISGFTELGGCIGIVQGETRLQFEVNRKSLEQSRLKASSQLLKLARNLDRPDPAGKQ